jgi:hypothetical protein
MGHVHIFLFSQKWSHKFFLSSEDLSEYKISWSYIDWLKFFIHLKSLSVHHFGVVAAAEYLPTGSEVDRKDRHTHRMLISASFFP